MSSDIDLPSGEEFWRYRKEVCNSVRFRGELLLREEG